MVDGRYTDILTNWFINQRSHHWQGTTLYDMIDSIHITDISKHIQNQSYDLI